MKEPSPNAKPNHFCNVTIDQPYPPIRPESRDPAYARAMLSNVGSDNSEMSAISLYFYNSVILDAKYAEFAQCFHIVSIVEMHHLDIFAKFACQMGLDPRLWCERNRRETYWTPAYNQYPREVRAVVENAIMGEKAAIRKYERQCETIRDKNIVENLQRIILDERRHIEIFDSMLERLR